MSQTEKYTDAKLSVLSWIKHIYSYNEDKQDHDLLNESLVYFCNNANPQEFMASLGYLLTIFDFTIKSLNISLEDLETKFLDPVLMDTFKNG